MNDPIADMLTRIRNTIAVNKREVSVPFSLAKQNLLKVLDRCGFIESFSAEGANKEKLLAIVINGENTAPKITHIKRISRPGLRHYVNNANIPRVQSGRGIVILSTSHGLMTGSEAKKAKVGGEVICEVY